MGGDVIDAGGRLAATRAEEIAGTGEALDERSDERPVAAPEGARRVAVTIVPLGPADREGPELVAAGTDVPRLRNHLDVGELRVGTQLREERRRTAEPLAVATEDRRKVEAEAVDAHVGGPVPQAIDHHRAHGGLVEVDRVAAARKIHVMRTVVGGQPVVDRVVEAAQVQRRTVLVAFGRVIEHDVEDDLEPGFMQRAHHRLELGDSVRDRVAGFWREPRQRVIAPVVREAALGRGTVRSRTPAPASARWW